jgi:cellulose synthase/poly-beta-1,6-N-acetylglucosamine synthase-like glycosyltransferase
MSESGLVAWGVLGVAALLTGVAVVVCLYYVALACWGLCARSWRQQPQGKEGGAHTFAIVIPAHNEEDGIAKSVLACQTIEYPKEKYTVYVIADNCTDQTVHHVQQAGATCLVRTDPVHRGKGYALEWGFARILPEGKDAIVVMDADCSMSQDALHVFDRCLTEGARVLQANNVVSNPDESSMTYALAVGNVIENELFYAPKSQLGLAVFLRGTGMVFHREILLRYPWQATSLAEDVEYTLGLLEQGIRVRFVPAARVASPFPVSHQQLTVQRTRWAKGNIGLGKSRALALIWKGLFKRSLLLFDAGWTLLVLVKPLILLELSLAVLMSLVAVLMVPAWISWMTLGVATGIVLSQGLYLVLGMWVLGLSQTRIRLFLNAPRVVVALLAITVKGLVGRGDIWIKTPRSRSL